MADRPRREPPFALLVPVGASSRIIDPASAVVAVRADRGWLAFYEGGRFGTMDWRDKVLHAADRLTVDYPTAAMCFMSDEEAVEVGVVGRDPATGDWTVLEVTDAPTLDAWSPGASTMTEASADQRGRAAGKALARGGSRAMTTLATARARGLDPVEALLSSVR